MTREKYLSIKAKLGELMYELEGVQEDEQQISGLPLRGTLIELLAEFSRAINRPQRQNENDNN